MIDMSNVNSAMPNRQNHVRGSGWVWSVVTFSKLDCLGALSSPSLRWDNRWYGSHTLGLAAWRAV